MDHQQICEFVNSKDVRKYLKDIGYEFSTPQAAWLVHRCQRLTMEERHKAWREIIRDMPDCAMEERNNMKRIDRFHAFLEDYIELEKRGVQEFMNGGNCIYRYRYHEIHLENAKYYNYWEDGDGFFSSYQGCIDHYKQQMGGDTDIDEVCVLKCGIDHLCSQMDRAGKLFLNSNLEILNVSMGCENDNESLAEVFDGMCFDFPVPFSRGDILIDRTARDRKPFVLSYILTWNSEKMLSSGFGESDCPNSNGWKTFDKVIVEKLKFGDYTDGVARGTVIDERDGSLSWDHFTQPTDMEYCRESLEGAERQLKALSYYKRGELSEEDFANLCCAIRMESIGKGCLWNFRDEFLESIGIRPKD